MMMRQLPGLFLVFARHRGELARWRAGAPERRIQMFSIRIVFLFLAWSLGGLAQAESCPRIVSQSPYISRALAWLGLGDCIVGVSRYDRLPLAHTGGLSDPDAAAIADLEPDLVIFSSWTPAALARAATPPEARMLRVGGYRGLAELGPLLRELGEAGGLPDAAERASAFESALQAALPLTRARQRVLILSACSETPYSYGQGTTLFELFSAAGFEVVADHAQIRNFRLGTPEGDFAAWIKARRPDFLFALQDSRAATCNPAIAEPGIPILPLTGEYFTHPGPLFLKGLEELRESLQAFQG